MFKNGLTSLAEDEQTRRPSTSNAEGNAEEVHAITLENQRVTTNEVAYHLQLSHGSANEIIQPALLS
jgi:hypothetical protein